MMSSVFSIYTGEISKNGDLFNVMGWYYLTPESYPIFDKTTGDYTAYVFGGGCYNKGVYYTSVGDSIVYE